MKWAIAIGTIFGIRVYVHLSFILLLIWAGLEQYLIRRNWGDVWSGLAFIGVVFGIVLLHEMGHSLTARRFGISTRDITLLPIGGVARLERMPEEPRQELIVALAGPAVNVALALLLFAALLVLGQFEQAVRMNPFDGNFLVRLVQVNLTLTAFNLLPAFPMDGGRVLRALLSMKLDYARATRIAAALGKSVAFVFALIGLGSLLDGRMSAFSNPLLLFIGLFVWIGAARECAMVQIKSRLGGIPVRELMITDFRTFPPEATLAEPAELLGHGWQHSFPIVQNGYVLGVLTRSEILAGLSEFGPGGLIGSVMERHFTAAAAAANAEQVLTKCRGGDDEIIPVIEQGRLIGLLSPAHIPDALAIRALLN